MDKEKNTNINIYVNDKACISNEWKQYRFPKTKKKRIRNKWNKNHNNFRNEEVHRIITVNNGQKIIVSQKIYNEIKKYLNTLS